MIKVSETAKKKVVELMQDDGFNPAEHYVRVGVKSGGCSGLSYDLKFDKNQEDGDKVFEDNGIKIIVDKKKFFVPYRNNTRVFRWFKWCWLYVQQPKCKSYLWLW
jgi:iron-sulfur cluster assembly protein